MMVITRLSSDLTTATQLDAAAAESSEWR